MSDNSEGTQVAVVARPSVPSQLTTGVKFRYFKEFCQVFGNDLGGKRTRDAQKHVLEMTKCNKNSVCDYLEHRGDHDLVGKAEWFISHAWDYDFLTLVRCVKDFLYENRGDATNDTVIWFDLFSINQHESQEKIPFEKLHQLFEGAIKAIGNVCMVIDPLDKPLTLKRAWCVYELLACHRASQPFDVTFATKDSSTLHSSDMLVLLHRVLSGIDTKSSKASVPDDEENIHTAVTTIAGSFDALNGVVFSAVRTALVARIQRYILFFQGSEYLGSGKMVLSLAQCLRTRSSDKRTVEEALQAAEAAKQYFRSRILADEVKHPREGSHILDEIKDNRLNQLHAVEIAVAIRAAEEDSTDQSAALQEIFELEHAIGDPHPRRLTRSVTKLVVALLREEKTTQARQMAKDLFSFKEKRDIYKLANDCRRLWMEFWIHDRARYQFDLDNSTLNEALVLALQGDIGMAGKLLEGLKKRIDSLGGMLFDFNVAWNARDLFGDTENFADFWFGATYDRNPMVRF
jgi:hypothetical protein